MSSTEIAAATGGVDAQIVAKLRRVVVPCGAIAAAVGAGGLIGAALEIDRMRSLLLGADSLMSVLTSTSLLALGIALILFERGGRRDILAACTLASFVLAMTVLTLIEYATGADLGIDMPLNEAPGTHFPGRPTPEAAAQFAIGATWLLLYRAERGIARLAASLAMAIIGLIALATSIAFVLAGSYVWDPDDAQSISLQALLAFQLLVFGGAALEPERWFLRPFVLSGVVGVALRHVLPAALAVPLLGGFAFELALADNAYATTITIAVIVTVETVLLGIAGLLAGRDLSEIESERDELEGELRWMAEHDPLTGLLNRRGLAAQLAGRDASEEFALAVLDLDGFKQLNDSAGHAYGDVVLRAIGTTLLNELRPGELAARIGGDEFAFLMDLPLGASAAARVEEIVALVAECETSGPCGPLRASAGVVHGTAGQAPDELIEAADGALYAAKRSGGARVELAEAVDDPPRSSV